MPRAEVVKKFYESWFGIFSIRMVLFAEKFITQIPYCWHDHLVNVELQNNTGSLSLLALHLEKIQYNCFIVYICRYLWQTKPFDPIIWLLGQHRLYRILSNNSSVFINSGQVKLLSCFERTNQTLFGSSCLPCSGVREGHVWIYSIEFKFSKRLS